MHRSEKAISGAAHSKSRSGAGEKDGFRPDIEGLRGVAVSLVVLFHAGLLSASPTQLTGGFIGVDLFFVISGFLITGLLIRERERNGRISFSRFYARRVRRILPAAVVTLLVTMIAANALLSIVDQSAAMDDAGAAALSVANIRFAMTTDYFNPVSYSPFLHFWSLGVEEQFYFVWPALLAIVAWKAPRVGAAVALTAVIVVSFAASLIITDTSPSTAFYLLPTRAWQLAAGGLLAVGAGSTDRLPRAIRGAFGQMLAFAGWAALAALITAAVVLDSKVTAYPGTAAIIPTIAGVLLIASGTERTGPGILLRLFPIRFLGKISYSLYLWHWPILILGGLYVAGPLQTITPTQALALAGLSVVVATASWLLVEEPFRRGIIPLPRPSRVVAVGVAIMLAVVLVSEGFNYQAQSALAALSGPDDAATPSESFATEPPPTPTPVPTPSRPSTTPPPGTTPTPVPQMTPALSPTPDPGSPTSYAITSSTRPSLGKAAKDYEATYAHCLAWQHTSTPNSSCVFGNTNGTFNVVLIGDSHASAMFPAVNGVAVAHGWRLTTYLKANCPFLDAPGLQWYGPPTVLMPECETWNDNVVGRVQKNHPDLVLITESRWIYVEDSTYRTITAEGNALAREIKKLPTGIKIVIIQDPPLPTDVDAPTCLGYYLSDYRKCNYARSLGFGSAMGTREKNAAGQTGSALVDLSAAVCPGTGACPVVINDMIAWRDKHHMTATFSATLAPELDAQLIARLNDWAALSTSP